MTGMRLSSKRLVGLLKPLRFSLCLADSVTKDIVFSRESTIPRMYEHLLIAGQGKLGEAVYATTAISAARWSPKDDYFSVFDRSLMFALETDRQRHWTIVRNPKEANQWEKRLAEVADTYCLRTSREHGKRLLERMDPVLEVIDAYVSHMGDINVIFDSEHRYTCSLSELERSKVSRLAAGKSEDFELAAVVLVRFGSAVEPGEDRVAGRKLHEDDQLRARLYLLADYIHDKRRAYAVDRGQGSWGTGT